MLFVRRRSLPEFLRTAIMPFLYVFICHEGESFRRQVDREYLSRIGIPDGEVADGGLYERDVFFGAEEDLDGLPAHETARCEGGDGGRLEVVGGGLEGMLAAY